MPNDRIESRSALTGGATVRPGTPAGRPDVTANPPVGEDGFAGRNRHWIKFDWSDGHHPHSPRRNQGYFRAGAGLG